MWHFGVTVKGTTLESGSNVSSPLTLNLSFLFCKMGVRIAPIL